MTLQTGTTWASRERSFINHFFQVEVCKRLGNDICSEQDCVQFAQEILNVDDLEPVPVQGATSYTLISGSEAKIVQFRLDALNDDVMALARKIYHDEFPFANFHAGFPLPVYTSEVMPGTVYFLLPRQKGHIPFDRYRRTVTDLAKFIGKTSVAPQPTCDAESWTASAPSALSRLVRNQSLKQLAPEIHAIVVQLQPLIHLLHTLPLVLTHKDLNWANIFADGDGRITGVIDFDGACAEAFGMAIFGVYESFLGVMDRGIFTFHDVVPQGGTRTIRELLEECFWEALWSCLPPGFITDKLAVKVALAISVINRYFRGNMLDEFEAEHARYQDYARKILPAVWLGTTIERNV
ncbi:hypothetical protein ANO11243_019870 [Dothideomycetidae sp. 11243]|nr:hypothetical protein ANO11243_019870 [fungal sp. No.11243]